MLGRNATEGRKKEGTEIRQTEDTKKNLNISVTSHQWLQGRAGAISRKQWRTQEFCSGGVRQIQLRTEERERGSGGGSPLVTGSGGSRKLVQEISFHIVKFY